MHRFPMILTLALLPAACDVIPDFRPSAATPPRAAAAAPVISVAPLASPVDAMPGVGDAAPVSAGVAESACRAAGADRGFQVQGVVGSTDVRGADGQPVSRDVMLRVARSGQVFDLRCSYHYASAQARVMAL
jgi:hypothetical protein